jgi:hypothetical protein
MKKELAQQYEKRKNITNPKDKAQLKVDMIALINNIDNHVLTIGLKDRTNKYAFIYETIMTEEHFIKPVKKLLNIKDEKL